MEAKSGTDGLYLTLGEAIATSVFSSEIKKEDIYAYVNTKLVEATVDTFESVIAACNAVAPESSFDASKITALNASLETNLDAGAIAKLNTAFASETMEIDVSKVAGLRAAINAYDKAVEKATLAETLEEALDTATQSDWEAEDIATLKAALNVAVGLKLDSLNDLLDALESEFDETADADLITALSTDLTAISDDVATKETALKSSISGFVTHLKAEQAKLETLLVINEGTKLNAVRRTSFYNVLADVTSEDHGETFINMNETVADIFSYISFDITFRATAAMDLYLGESEVLAVGNVSEKVKKNQITSPWTKEAEDYGAALNAGKPIVARAANATRIAFVNEDVTKIWAANETISGGGAGFFKGNLARDYAETLGISQPEVPTYTPSNVLKPLVKGDDGTYSLTDDNANATKITSLEWVESYNGSTAYVYQTTLSVKIWLDGNDGDCFNSILEDIFSVAMQFVGIQTPVAP